VLGGSTLVAILIASFFERRIAQPILSLASTARRISEEKNFSLRANENHFRRIEPPD